LTSVVELGIFFIHFSGFFPQEKKEVGMRKLLFIIPLALILCFMIGCQNKEAMAELEEFKAQAEVEAQNEEFVRHYIEELNKNSGFTNELLELTADDFKWYIWGSIEPLDKEASLQLQAVLYGSFPDLTYTIEDMIAKGDKVVVRCTTRGTHEGEFQGIPPTGKKIEYEGIQIWKIKDGKVVEGRVQADILMMMQQLGMELKPKEEKK
jgi:steroid delta-isomerase-like uncharacterized protein